MRWARKATGSAAVIVNPRGEVLLVRRAYTPNDWVLPGGNADADESPVETVVREVAEEVGLVAHPERLTGVYYQADHHAGEFIHFVFRCSVDDGAVPNIRAGEIEDCGFFAPDSLPVPMSDSTQRGLRDGLTTASQPLPITLPMGSER